MSAVAAPVIRTYSMTREFCEACHAPFLRSVDSAAKLCCGCALGFAPGKAPSWVQLGGRTVEERGGGGGVRQSDVAKRVCSSCGNEFRGAKDACYPCRERERHRRRYLERQANEGLTGTWSGSTLHVSGGNPAADTEPLQENVK